MSRPRALWRVLRLMGLLACCAPLHLLRHAAGRPSPWPWRFLASAARAAGLDVRVEGTLADGPLLIVANHVSWLDILALGSATGAGFVSKGDVARWPVAGWLARQNGTIFVDRAERGQARAQADALAAALADGRRIALFAEGTTGPGDRLLPFRPALFAAVAGTAVRVQPVAIDYGAARTTLAWPDGEPMNDNAMRVLGLPGRRRVTVRLLPPLDPAGHADRKALAVAAWARVAAALSLPGGEA